MTAAFLAGLFAGFCTRVEPPVLGRSAVKFKFPATDDPSGSPMSIAGIDTVAVVVADGMKALAWYRDVLGLEVAYVPPGGGHWMELGSLWPRTRIHLC